jgi:hypothetical protein
VPESRDLPRGAIVGVVDIVGCTLGSCHEPSLPSDWWEGPVGFQFARPRLLKKPIPCEGKRRFFVPPEAVLQAIAEQLG